MSDLLAARAQMAVSLGFHILFAVAGIAMPLLMIVAEALWLRTREPVYLDLAKRWSKGVSILFAVGAVSGTVLSFELGLLWPRFMAVAGPIIGMPFSLEGAAFFLEAIFLGVYLYGWDRVPPLAHWASGALVLVSGVMSGVFVVSANAWMNTPAGFRLESGRVVEIDPWAAMLNPAFPAEALHMTLASFVTVGFAVAGIHAWLLLRDRTDPFHRAACAIALTVGGAAALLQPLSGDLSARHVAEHQKAKLAAMEGLETTTRGAPLRLGPIAVPRLLSLLAYRDPDAEVLGLDAFPERERPPARIVRPAFQVMVACGATLAAVSLLAAALAWRRRRLPDDPRFLRALVACGPLGFIALEAGWTVTEVGRQPWIARGLMRVDEALTPMPGLAVPFALITLVYVLLGAIVAVLLRRLFLETRRA